MPVNLKHYAKDPEHSGKPADPARRKRKLAIVCAFVATIAALALVSPYVVIPWVAASRFGSLLEMRKGIKPPEFGKEPEIAESIAGLGHVSVGSIARYLDSRDPRERRAAAYVLMFYDRSVAAGAVPAMQRALSRPARSREDRDAEIHLHTALAIAADQHEPHISWLKTTVREKESGRSQVAASCLGRVAYTGVAREEIIAFLNSWVDDPDLGFLVECVLERHRLPGP